tara:strand:+ start:941 stop:1393 length:453 start_codon:yes stop_codon:yes gene_type:complete
MKKKFILFLIVFFTLSNCGYNPIYSNQSKINFNLMINEINGDEVMNNIVRSQIKKYENISKEKTTSLNIKTAYSKDILSKNKKGEITNYLIKMEIEFEDISSKNKKYNFKEETKTSSMSNKFELKKYENTIINNFISNQLEKFILKINSL